MECSKDEEEYAKQEDQKPRSHQVFGLTAKLVLLRNGRLSQRGHQLYLLFFPREKELGLFPHNWLMLLANNGTNFYRKTGDPGTAVMLVFETKEVLSAMQEFGTQPEAPLHVSD